MFSINATKNDVINLQAKCVSSGAYDRQGYPLSVEMIDSMDWFERVKYYNWLLDLLNIYN